MLLLLIQVLILVSKKLLPLILGVGFGYTALIILINFVLIQFLKIIQLFRSY